MYIFHGKIERQVFTTALATVGKHLVIGDVIGSESCSVPYGAFYL